MQPHAVKHEKIEVDEEEMLRKLGGDSVPVLNDETFDMLISHFDLVLVAFGAPWCPWSQRLDPVWIKVCVRGCPAMCMHMHALDLVWEVRAGDQAHGRSPPPCPTNSYRGGHAFGARPLVRALPQLNPQRVLSLNAGTHDPRRRTSS